MKQDQTQRILYVNGYGATHDLQDPNYRRYLMAVVNHIRREGAQTTLYLCGGFTNRTDLSEAECMRLIWDEVKDGLTTPVILLEETTTARANLKAFRKMVGDVPVTIFCEESRAAKMRFLATRFFSDVQMVGVPFDQKSLRLKNRITELCVTLPLEVAAFYSPLFDRWRIRRRERHVAREREKAKKEGG